MIDYFTYVPAPLEWYQNLRDQLPTAYKLGNIYRTPFPIRYCYRNNDVHQFSLTLRNIRFRIFCKTTNLINTEPYRENGANNH